MDSGGISFKKNVIIKMPELPGTKLPDNSQKNSNDNKIKTMMYDSREHPVLREKIKDPQILKQVTHKMLNDIMQGNPFNEELFDVLMDQMNENKDKYLELDAKYEELKSKPSPRNSIEYMNAYSTKMREISSQMEDSRQDMILIFNLSFEKNTSLKKYSARPIPGGKFSGYVTEVDRGYYSEEESKKLFRQQVTKNFSAVTWADIKNKAQEKVLNGRDEEGDPIFEDKGYLQAIPELTKASFTEAAINDHRLGYYTQTHSKIDSLLLTWNKPRRQQEVHKVFNQARIELISNAAEKYGVDPKLIASMILAEQRDQTAMENYSDKEWGSNPSVGLGQITVNTAKELFPEETKDLSNREIARKLAKDEDFNIQCVAKYLQKKLIGKESDYYKKYNVEFAGNDYFDLQKAGSIYTSSGFEKEKAWGKFVAGCYYDIEQTRLFK